jgi:hypothetical protein
MGPGRIFGIGSVDSSAILVALRRSSEDLVVVGTNRGYAPKDLRVCQNRECMIACRVPSVGASVVLSQFCELHIGVNPQFGSSSCPPMPRRVFRVRPDRWIQLTSLTIPMTTTFLKPFLTGTARTHESRYMLAPSFLSYLATQPLKNSQKPANFPKREGSTISSPAVQSRH